MAVQQPAQAAQAAAKPKVAVVATVWKRPVSHAETIVPKFLAGYDLDGVPVYPSVQVASIYVDQFPKDDTSRRWAARFGVPIMGTIREALTLGGDRLAVDGVIRVGEHGDYPWNEKGQHLYPRYELFREIVAVYRLSGKTAPLFNDKHLSWKWEWAKEMVEISRELNFGFAAGSSLPVTFRRPELDYPLGVRFDDALMVGGGWTSDGGIFHDLETLQCFVERRAGGETGIRTVQHLEGDAVWRAAEEGRWSKDLMKAALSRGETVGPGRPEDVSKPVLGLIEYNDGFRAAILALGGLVNEYLVAFRVKGRAEIDSTLCYIPTENSNNFSMLVHGINQMYQTGKPSHPVERTLLTTGALAFLMESAHQGHKRLETPMLRVNYKPPAESFYAHGRGS